MQRSNIKNKLILEEKKPLEKMKNSILKIDFLNNYLFKFSFSDKSEIKIQINRHYHCLKKKIIKIYLNSIIQN